MPDLGSSIVGESGANDVFESLLGVCVWFDGDDRTRRWLIICPEGEITISELWSASRVSDTGVDLSLSLGESGGVENSLPVSNTGVGGVTNVVGVGGDEGGSVRMG